MSLFAAIVTLGICLIIWWRIMEAAGQRNLAGVIAWLALLLLFILG